MSDIKEERFESGLGANGKSAIIVGHYRGKTEKAGCDDSLDELEELLSSCDICVCGKVVCSLKFITSATFIGSGKVEEISELAKTNHANVVVFDDELSPAQQRNLEKSLKIPVMDRSEIILDVFSRKAKSKEAKLQVQLALVKYNIPRLKRLWTHLSRQRGGGVNQKGEGEAQIEIDKRLLRKQETKLCNEIDLIKRRRGTRTLARLRVGLYSFAIVGYTNAGKSTLMNFLTEAGVLAEDRMFASLDTVTRQLTFSSGVTAVITDTVGFIRKLPHSLVAAFRSTLEESLISDCLIIVLDVSHRNVSEHLKTTHSVLKELKAIDKPCITIFNKMDIATPSDIEKAQEMVSDAIFCSAKNGKGIDQLLSSMNSLATQGNTIVKLSIPITEYNKIVELHQIGSVLESKYEGEAINVIASIPPEKLFLFSNYFSR